MDDITVIYNISHEVPFGTLIALFTSLTGLNAGSYLASVVFIYIGKKEYLPLAKFSALAVIFLCILAPLLLLLDITQPWYFWHLFIYFSPSSPMAWGTLILTVYPFLASIYIWHLLHNDLGRAKMWGFIGLPIALGSHGFVGFVLSFSKGRILWSTSMTPLFFIVSAALSGLALVVIFDTVRYYLFLKSFPEAQNRERLIFHQLGKALYILIFADLTLILFYLLRLGFTPYLFNHILGLMNQGALSPSQFLLSLSLGLLVPLALLIIPWTARRPWGQMIASLLIVGGVFSMGHFVFFAGQGLSSI